MTLAKLNIIVILVVVVGAAAFGFCIMMPGINELQQREELIAVESATVERKQQEVGKISDLYASIVALDKKKSTFQERLPNEHKFGEFLQAVSDCLTKNSITDPKLQQKDELELDPAKLPPVLQLTKEATILPLSVEFDDSSYSNVFAFLDQLESLERIAHVESLQMINSESHPGRVKVVMQMHTYRRRGTMTNQ